MNKSEVLKHLDALKLGALPRSTIIELPGPIFGMPAEVK